MNRNFKILTFLFFVVIFISCKFDKNSGEPKNVAAEASYFTYQNPIRSGIDSMGLRDCQVLRDGDNWYLTGTSYPHWPREEENGNFNKGVVLYRSKNLTDWQLVKYIVEAGDSTKWYHRRFWAPEIQKINNKYYALFNCNNDQAGYVGQHNGYAVSENIEGPYTVVTESEPLTRGNDLTFFQEENGSVWAFWNQGREKGIQFAQVDLQKGKLITDPVTAILPGKVDYKYDGEGNIEKTPGYNGRPIDKVEKYYDWDSIGIEGAYVIKEGDTYYLFYSSWTRGYEIGIAKARKITGPWVKSSSNPIYGAQSKEACENNGMTYTGNPDNPFNQVGHNEIFIGPDGRRWLSCHGIKPGENPFLVIDPITISKDGEIKVDGPTYTLQKVKIN
ncbi:glycoside hydrolase family 43 protein [Leeuwenhoekiella parthenopeia]|uniref:Family 43 glycosylhydrolase n=1 Tax=Leeuwenhoekiella parthenopeia TaxID=2890320 RepID=A0ABS8GMR8_9FLAO|nr:family 43 glycosylhydrolase [Leeuwenhoekiella parthenopeia]MCC4211279.1 family 43 glycosylhydrolase [Leeuwenhoekiella parthenopeia]